MHFSKKQYFAPSLVLSLVPNLIKIYSKLYQIHLKPIKALYAHVKKIFCIVTFSINVGIEHTVLYKFNSIFVQTCYKLNCTIPRYVPNFPPLNTNMVKTIQNQSCYIKIL